MTQSDIGKLEPKPGTDPTELLPAGSGNRRKRLGAYRPTIREALLHNATLPEWQRLTAPDLAKRLGVSVKSVYVAASTMRQQGVLALKTARPPRDVPGSAAVVDAFKMAQDMRDQEPPSLEGTAIMSDQEIAQKLSQLGRESPAAVSVNAVTKLHEIKRNSGVTAGPPDPLSFEERADRLARILMVVGKAVLKRAEELAWPVQDSSDSVS